MATTRHIALLRGINVGGNNIIKMADLRASFAAMGFTDVATLIQSGNVAFSAAASAKARLVKIIEETLSERFGYRSRIVLISARELEQVIAQAPAGFGRQPERYRYDVLFVKAPLTSAEALRQVPTRAGVDDVHAGRHALYFRRLISKATQSHLPRLIQLPLYQSVTIRNWNTTTTLARMF